MAVIAMGFLGWGACKMWDSLAGHTELHRQNGPLVKGALVIAVIVLVLVFGPAHLFDGGGYGEPDVPVNDGD